MPPISTLNGLKLTETDKQIQEQQLELTELEGALIAKNIIFQKIFQLPKSRWTALKDRVINVPVNEDSIMNTLEQLPRTPKDAGLIGVALKRKMEFKNTHKHQLVNPDKMFRMLNKLKKSNNPYYKFYDDYNVYRERCSSDDPTGFDVIFNQDYDVIHDIKDIEQMDNCPAMEVTNHDTTEEDENEETKNENDKIEIMKKDPI